MGHLSARAAYQSLQQRLDMMPIGAPPHRALFALLEELFTEQECRVAAAMPLRVVTADKVAANAGLDLQRTTAILETLAGKGLVADLPRPGKPTLYFLNPTIVGFFEYSMMRVRDDIDQHKVAGLMWEYLREDPKLAFLQRLTNGETFITRPLVNEEVLGPELHSEVLDWEKASHLIDEAGSWAESICHCRHVQLHRGKRCSYPLEHCLSLGRGADYLVRNGLATPIERGRAHEIVAIAREHGAVQMADNVRDWPGFICNCCQCCCEILEGLRTIPHAAKVVTSNYLASSDDECCNGCGKCAVACPIDAIEMVAAGPTVQVPKRKQRASIDGERCLGCGVCAPVCRTTAITLQPVGQRVLAPESIMERLTLQAVERGTLQHLLLNDPTRLTHRTLAAMLGALLKLPPAKQLLASRQLKSKFVKALLRR